MRTTGKTKAQIVEEVWALPDYMRAAGQIIGILKTLDTTAYSPYRDIDDQRAAALKLAAGHFRLDMDKETR